MIKIILYKRKKLASNLMQNEKFPYYYRWGLKPDFAGVLLTIYKGRSKRFYRLKHELKGIETIFLRIEFKNKSKIILSYIRYI